MKLTQIRVWNSPGGRYTRLIRCYTDPGIEHRVVLYPTGVETYLFKGDMNHPIKPGIQHLTRP